MIPPKVANDFGFGSFCYWQRAQKAPKLPVTCNFIHTVEIEFRLEFERLSARPMANVTKSPELAYFLGSTQLWFDLARISYYDMQGKSEERTLL